MERKNENPMIDAKIARELARKGHLIKIEDELKDIFQKIKENAESGVYHMNLKYQLYPENVKKLEELGYSITFNSVIYTTIISWD